MRLDGIRDLAWTGERDAVLMPRMERELKDEGSPRGMIVCSRWQCMAMARAA
jgi:hypothetical protein